ncbi:MAG: DUF4129 domain-containing protein [Pseudomonadota bacterium]
MARLLFLFVVMVLGLSAPGHAQHAELDGLEIRPSGEAYIRATRLRGLDRAVAYFDPSQPPPPFEAPEPERTENTTSLDAQPGPVRNVMIIVSAAVLMLIAYLVVTNAGGLSVALAKPGDASGGRAAGKGGRGSPETARAMGLDAILAMQDRREALVALCRSLLARVVAAEGVLLHKSWTDRDTLRRVPRDHPHRAALQELVFASEKVQFGGRDVTDEDFRDHVDRLRSLWTSGAAT